MEWIDDCAVVPDPDVAGYTLFTVLPDGTLEIRGPEWKKRRTYPRLQSEEQARRVAERLSQLIAPPNQSLNPTAKSAAG